MTVACVLQRRPFMDVRTKYLGLELEHSEAILRGVRAFGTLREGLTEWMDRHGFHEISQIRGLLNLAHCSNPSAFERASYMHVLNAWHPMLLDLARGVW